MCESEEPKETDVYHLPTAGDEFTLKSKSVFDNLLVLESKHAALEKARASSRQSIDDEDGLWKEDPDEQETETIKPKNPNTSSSRNFCEDSWLPQSKYGQKRTHDGKDADERSQETVRGSGDRDSSRSSTDRDSAQDLRDRDTDQHPKDRGRGQQRDYDQGSVSRGFKRPFFRAPRGGRKFVPQFKKNPEQWTAYSLADVDDKSLSDSSNKKAAFEFLNERKKLREMAEGSDVSQKADVVSMACSKEAFVFKKPKANSNSTDSSSNPESAETVLSDSGKVRLPRASEIAVEMEVSDPTEEVEVTPVAASETVSFKSRKAKGQRHMRRVVDTAEEEEDEEDTPLVIQRNKTTKKSGFDPASIDDT